MNLQQRYFFIFFLTAFNILYLKAQKIGDWTSYLPYQSGITVAQSESKIYYGTEWSIVQIDKEDFSSKRISKVDGLSDIGVKEIEFDDTNDQLIIAYTNGNIDFLKDQEVINLPNIKLNTDLIGTKSVNNINVSGDMIYLSTGFGLVTISSNDLLFGSTTFTDIPVQESVIFEDQIFISTDEGVFFAPSDGSENLIDFSLWHHIDESFGLPILYSSSGISVYEDQLYFVADDKLFRWDNGRLTEIWTSPSDNISLGFLSSDGDFLMLGVIGNDRRGDVFFYDGQTFLKSGNGCNDVIQDVIQDQFGRVWYADEYGGFRITENIQSDCQHLNFNSPLSHEVSDIAIRDNEVYVASGGVKDNYDYSFTRSGYYFLKNRDWQNINQDNEIFIKENDLLNFLKIKPHPNKEELYIGTYWGGLLKVDEAAEILTLFDESNSALLGTIGDEQRERITGLQFDLENNLWVTSFGSPRPLALLDEDGQWTNFSLGSNKNLIDVVQDEFGYLWIPAFGNNGGCYVFDPGSDLAASGDDNWRFITSSSSNMTTNVVNTVAVDLDGAVWIGTAEGPIIFDCGSDPFDLASCSGDRVKVLQDSIVAFLLADQDILSIEVDGANQKWFGTRNGIFVQSPDGEEEIYRFTVDNSPLFDNRIRDLAFNKESGELMIGTDRGLQSFKTPSTEGKPIHLDTEVLVFPNPVQPNYDGPIAVKGLVRDALVKITDINGNLVTEVRAQGGQAVWNGEDISGRKVQTGVYLIFSTDDKAFDRPDSYVTKVMVIR